LLLALVVVFTVTDNHIHSHLLIHASTNHKHAHALAGAHTQGLAYRGPSRGHGNRVAGGHPLAHGALAQ
jgi:hypothetical protein